MATSNKKLELMIDFLFPTVLHNTKDIFFSTVPTQHWPPEKYELCTWQETLRWLQVTCGHGLQSRGVGRQWSGAGAVYRTILNWSVFVEIIKEPYISAWAPQGLVLPADLHAGRRVMKQAWLEIHHCGKPRRFSPSVLPRFLPLSSTFAQVFPPAPPLSQFWVCLNVLHCIWLNYSIRGSCVLSVFCPSDMILFGVCSFITTWLKRFNDTLR